METCEFSPQRFSEGGVLSFRRGFEEPVPWKGKAICRTRRELAGRFRGWGFGRVLGEVYLLECRGEAERLAARFLMFDQRKILLVLNLKGFHVIPLNFVRGSGKRNVLMLGRKKSCVVKLELVTGRFLLHRFGSRTFSKFELLLRLFVICTLMLWPPTPSLFLESRTSDFGRKAKLFCSSITYPLTS
jgi:hypothetical protein